MALEFRARPSSLLDLEGDPYVAWCFDEACYSWGKWVDAQLSEAESQGDKPAQKKQKREMAWNRIFGDEARGSKKSQFRDPAEVLGKS